MDQQEVDRRIEEAKTRGSVRTIAIPGQRSHRIIVENGQEAMRPLTSARKGQVDASVPPMVTTPGENPARVAQRIGDSYNANHVPEPATEIKVGAVVLRPLSVTGWEKRFTANAGDFELVCEDGFVERTANVINKLLYAELLRLSQAAKAGKK